MARRGAVRVPITGDSSDLKREVREAEHALNRLGRNSSGFDRIGVAAQTAEQRLTKFNTSAQTTRNVIGLIKPAAVITGIGLMGNAFNAAAAGAAGLAAALTPLVGLTTSAGQVFGSIGQSVGVATLAFKGLDEALKGNEEALRKLTPEARDFVETLKSFEPIVERLQRTAQQGLFPGLEKGMKAAAVQADRLNAIVGRTATVMGNRAADVGGIIGSASFGRDLTAVGNANVRMLDNMAKAGIGAGQALRHIMVAAIPLQNWLGTTIRQIGEWTGRTAAAGRASGALGRFFAETQRTARLLGDTLLHTGRGLLEVGKHAKPLGDFILRGLNREAAQFDRWSRSISGQGALRKYFADARAPIAEFGRLLKAAGGELLKFSNQRELTQLMRMIRTDLLPAFGALARQTAGTFGPHLIRALRSITLLFGDLAGSSGPLTVLVDVLGLAAEGLHRLLNASPALKTLVVSLTAVAAAAKAIQFAGAITGLTKFTRAVRSQDSVIRRLMRRMGTSGGEAFASSAAGSAAGEMGPSFAKNDKKMRGPIVSRFKSVGTAAGAAFGAAFTAIAIAAAAVAAIEIVKKLKDAVDQGLSDIPGYKPLSDVRDFIGQNIPGPVGDVTRQIFGKGRRAGGRAAGPILAAGGELLVDPMGKAMMVPGNPRADQTLMMAAPGSMVFTGHGQAMLAAGASPQQALAQQLPHFARGGEVRSSAQFTPYNLPSRMRRAWSRGGSAAVTSEEIAATAEAVGLPGKTFAQIAAGESGNRPGAVSGDGGHGLWQMTPRVWGAALRRKIAALGSFFNPLSTARQAKVLYDSGGISPWYGTKYVTGHNLHYYGGALKVDGMPSMGRTPPLEGQPGGPRSSTRGDPVGTRQVRTVHLPAPRDLFLPDLLQPSTPDIMEQGFQAGLEGTSLFGTSRTATTSALADVFGTVAAREGDYPTVTTSTLAGTPSRTATRRAGGGSVGDPNATKRVRAARSYIDQVRSKWGVTKGVASIFVAGQRKFGGALGISAGNECGPPHVPGSLHCKGWALDITKQGAGLFGGQNRAVGKWMTRWFGAQANASGGGIWYIDRDPTGGHGDHVHADSSSSGGLDTAYKLIRAPKLPIQRLRGGGIVGRFAAGGMVVPMDENVKAPPLMTPREFIGSTEFAGTIGGILGAPQRGADQRIRDLMRGLVDQLTRTANSTAAVTLRAQFTRLQAAVRQGAATGFDVRWGRVFLEQMRRNLDLVGGVTTNQIIGQARVIRDEIARLKPIGERGGRAGGAARTAIQRLQGVLTLLEGTIGERLAGPVRIAQSVAERISGRDRTRTEGNMILRGIDPSSLTGLGVTQRFNERSIQRLTAQIKPLQFAAITAQTAGNRGLAAQIVAQIAAINDQIFGLRVENKQIGNTAEELQRQAADAAQQAAEAARQAAEEAARAQAQATLDQVSGGVAAIDRRVRAGLLTPEQGRQQRIAHLQGALNGVFGWISPEDFIDIMGQLREETEGNTQALQDNTAALTEQNDLLKQQRDEARKLANTSQTQYGVLAQALADIVSGRIGGRLGLGFQTPSAPGVLARS
jgi:hypothetical protein